MPNGSLMQVGASSVDCLLPRRPEAVQLGVKRVQQGSRLPLCMWLSHLESVAIKPATEQQYKDILVLFLTWTAQHNITWQDSAELDRALILMFDQMFFHGRSVEDASKLVSATQQTRTLHYTPTSNSPFLKNPQIFSDPPDCAKP